MEKMIKEKKGLFFTISIVFLAPALIILWTLSLAQVDLERGFVIDRVYGLSNSVTSSLKEIFLYYYDSKVSIERIGENINVTFDENISGNKDEWSKEFSQMINNFRVFVQREEPNVQINVSGLENKETPSVILPHNITYSRLWGTGHVIISVKPESMNFNSYDIMINTTSLEIDKDITQFKAAGNFSFSVTAVDNYGHRLVQQKDVDPTDSHQIQIYFVGGNKIKIDLINKALEVWTNTPDKIMITTRMDGLAKTDEKIRVMLFQNAVNVSFPSLEAERVTSLETIEE
jgi:hypothetical protein